MQKQADRTRFFRLEQVLERTGLSRSTIYEMIAEGSFPQPRKLRGQINGWRETDLARWAENRPQARIGRSS